MVDRYGAGCLRSSHNTGPVLLQHDLLAGPSHLRRLHYLGRWRYAVGLLAVLDTDHILTVVVDGVLNVGDDDHVLRTYVGRLDINGAPRIGSGSHGVINGHGLHIGIRCSPSEDVEGGVNVGICAPVVGAVIYAVGT